MLLAHNEIMIPTNESAPLWLSTNLRFELSYQGSFQLSVRLSVRLVEQRGDLWTLLFLQTAINWRNISVHKNI